MVPRNGLVSKIVFILGIVGISCCFSFPLFGPDSASALDGTNQLIVTSDGTITDSENTVMWAGADNGKNINWQQAKELCSTYNEGGFNNWRLPKLVELEALYQAGGLQRKGPLKLSGIFLWAAESKNGKAAFFRVQGGRKDWESMNSSRPVRVLPVRDIR